MKVCVVAHRFPPHLGGNELYAERLASELTSHGHDVTVYTTTCEDTREFPFGVREFTNVVPQSFGYFGWPGVFSPPVLRELRSFDVVHAVNASMFTAVVGAVAKTLSPTTKTVLTTTYHAPSAQTHKRLKRAYDRLVLQRVLETYDYLLVSSRFELAQLKGQFDLAECEVVRVDIPPMVHADVDPDDRYEGSSRFSVLFVGRLDANKGVHDLLEAVSTLVDRGVDIECIVVGERERWYEWPERVQTFVELSDHLDFRGFVSEGELAATYAEADVLVLPSEYETFGQVIVEALRSGTPVVATPVGIAPERIVDGVNGAVYDPADPENLVEALSRVRTADRRTLRAESVRSVVDLTWTGLVECLEELYAR